MRRFVNNLITPTLGIIVILIIIPEINTSTLCPRGIQYWDTSQQKCMNCTICSSGQVVLRPCQPHIDTFCGPLSALLIDWSFIRPSTKQHQQTTSTLRVITNKPTTRGKKVSTSVTKTTASTTLSTLLFTDPVTTEKTIKLNTISDEEDEVIEDTKLPTSPLLLTTKLPPPKRVVSAQPFSAVERLVWDWQSLTLVVAITSSAIFMVLLAIYAVIQARSATRRRKSLERELEEATAHLSLFTSGATEQATMVAEGLLPASRSTAATDTNEGLYSVNQCLYMEKLLERKQRQSQRGARGNIYVETGRQATPSPTRRSNRWKAKQGGLR